MRKLAAAALALFLFSASPLPILAQTSTTHTAVMTVGDILIMRPFSFAATVVGFAVFVVGYPIIALTDNDTAWENMVVKPAHATFTRCIGCDMLSEPEASSSEGSAESNQDSDT